MKKQKKAISRRVIALSLAVLLLFVPFSSNLGEKVDVKADETTDTPADGGDTSGDPAATPTDVPAVTPVATANFTASYTIENEPALQSETLADGTQVEHFALTKNDSTYTFHVLSDGVNVNVTPDVKWKDGGLEFTVEKKGGTIDVTTDNISIPGWDNTSNVSVTEVPIKSITPIYTVKYQISGGFYPYSDSDSSVDYLEEFADPTQLIDIGTDSFSVDAANNKYALYLKAKVVSADLTGAECIPYDSNQYSTGYTDVNLAQTVVWNAIDNNNSIEKYNETWKNKMNDKAVYSLQKKYEYIAETLTANLEGKDGGVDIDDDRTPDVFRSAELNTDAYYMYTDSTAENDAYFGEVKYSIMTSDVPVESPSYTDFEDWGKDGAHKTTEKSGYNYGAISYCIGDTVVKTEISGAVLIDRDKPVIEMKGLFHRESDGITWKQVNVSDGYGITDGQARSEEYRYVVGVKDKTPLEEVVGRKCVYFYDDNPFNFTKDDGSMGIECDGGDIYYYTITENDLPYGQDYTTELQVYVNAKDKVGNEYGKWDNKLTPTIKKFNGDLDVTATFYVNGQPTAFPRNSNQQVQVDLVAKSGRPIRTFDVVDLHADGDTTDDEVIASATIDNKDFENTTTTDGNVSASTYNAEWTFYLPASVLTEESSLPNKKMDNIVVRITDGVWNEESASVNPGNQWKEITIGEFIYDASKPTCDISNKPENETWYKSYTLEGVINTGKDGNFEDRFDYAGYCMMADGGDIGESDYSDIPTKDDGSADVSRNFAIDVAPSTTLGGTKVVFAAKDKSGNELEDNKEIYIRVDDKAPVINADEMYVLSSATGTGRKVGADHTPEGGGEFTGNPVIRVSAKDNLTLDYAEYMVLYGSEQTIGKVNLSLDSPGQDNSFDFHVQDGTGKVRDGKYTVVVRVYDKAGNKSDEQHVMFTVDNTPPVFNAEIASGTKGGKSPRENGTDWYYNSATVGVALTIDDDNIDTSAVTIRDGDTVIDPPTWVNGSGIVNVTGEGSHTITITGKDKAGNEGEPKSVSFVIDSVKPTTYVTLNGSEYSEARGRINSTTDVTVRFGVDDANRDGSDYNCVVLHKVPGQADSETRYMPTSETTYTFSEDGDYTVSFFARDMANNQSDVRTARFRIDKNAPQIQILGASGSTTSDTTITFVMNETMWQDASGEATIYRKAGDGREELVYKTIQLTPTSADTRISEVIRETGTYRIEMSAKDQIGHTTSLNQTFTMDKSAPVVSMTGVNNYDMIDGAIEFYVEVNEEFFVNKTVSVTGTRTDMDGKVENLEYSKEIVQGANPTIFRKTFDQDGIYDLKVLARDPSGNERTDSVHFVIDTKAPVIGDLSDYEDQMLREFNWDIDLDELVSDLTVCDTHMYLNGSEYDGSSDIEDGVYTLLIVAEDELGHKTEKSINFTLDTKAPVFIVTGVENGQIKNEAYSIDVSLQLDEDILKEVQLNGSPVTISEGNTAHISVTSEGKYELTMKAVDQAGNEANQLISFAYGVEKKAGSNWWIIVVACVGGLAVIGGFIAFIKRRKDSQ